MSDKADPTDPANSAIHVLKSPIVIAILSLIVFMTPTIMGVLPANAALAAVIVCGLKIVALIHGMLKNQNAAIQGSVDIAVTKAAPINPPTSPEPSA
jgi:hypothetical protein